MKSILVLDDNPQNNSSFVQPLMEFYQVDVAMAITSAERLIHRKKIQHKMYDLIIIDIMMPTQNLEIDNELLTGFEFYERRIKKEHPNQKVLFWSILTKKSYDDFFIDESNINIDFIQKNFEDDNHLLKKVQGILH